MTNNPLQSIQTPDLLQERLARLKAELPDLFTSEGQINPEELLRLTGQQGRERFDFSWWGKSQAKRNAFSPTTAALRYDAVRSVNPNKAGGNAIIEGENLEVLKLLLCAYRGQVKCIYIDPPYNTGNDFVYSDHFAEGERAYWEQTGITEGGVKMSTNTRSDGRFHSKWLNMIYPRLLVARQLLREDGVIFVSIDDNEVTHLRKVMDEVFGEENFVAKLIWKSKSGGAMDSRYFAVDHEYVVVYGRSAEKITINLDTEAEVTSNYNLKDDVGRYLLRRLDQASLGYMPSLDFPIEGPDGKIYLVPQDDPKVKKARWRWGKDTVKERYSELVFKDSFVYTKVYEKEGSIPRSLLIEERFGRTRTGKTELVKLLQREVFDNPKPSRLVQFILRIATSESDLILDFFGGSGTTMHAGFSLSGNRRIISVQIPEATDDKSEAHKTGFKKISDITIERVKRVIQGYGDNPQPIDAGFKVFTLEKSAFPRADFAPDPDATEAEQLAALKAFIADKEASLFNTLDPQAVRDEVLLKCGFQLDVQLTPIAEVTANQLYHARDQQTPPREAIVCFDSHLDTTTLEWLGQQKGQRVIVLEAALDTTGKWNLHHQLGDGLVVF